MLPLQPWAFWDNISCRLKNAALRLWGYARREISNIFVYFCTSLEINAAATKAAKYDYQISKDRSDSVLSFMSIFLGSVFLAKHFWVSTDLIVIVYRFQAKFLMKRPGNDSLLLVEARDELEVRYCREVPMLLDGRTWYFHIKQVKKSPYPLKFNKGHVWILNPCIYIYTYIYTFCIGYYTQNISHPGMHFLPSGKRRLIGIHYAQSVSFLMVIVWWTPGDGTTCLAPGAAIGKSLVKGLGVSRKLTWNL